MRKITRKCIYVPHTGGLLPTVLLPRTLEDTWSFTAFQSLHGAAKNWLQ